MMHHDCKEKISELEKTIAEQQEEIRYLKNIISKMPGNVFWKDKDGYYLGANENQLRIVKTHYKKEFIGLKVSDFIEPHFAQAIEENDRLIISSGQTKIFEERWVDEQGNLATYLSHKIPLFNSAEEVVGLLGVSVDISDRKEMELELQRTKELAEQQGEMNKLYLHNLIASLPENFYWLNTEGKLLGCNENQAKILGLTPAELVGKSVYKLADMFGWDKNIAETIRQNDLEVMATKKTKVIEEMVIVNGEKRFYLSYKSPMLDEKGNVIGLFGVAVDITERRQMEEDLRIAKERAELASQAKTAFIANMSHDIRTPFSGILGVAKILEKREQVLEKKQMIGDIVQSSEKLLKLLNDILELSARKNEYMELKFNLHDSIDKSLKILAIDSKRKNLKTFVTIANDVPSLLIGNQIKLERVLLNLLSNAVKFTEAGHVSVHVKVVSQILKDITLEIKVEDTGIGIEASKLEEIFGQFIRLNPSYASSYQGYGLGLYTVKQYVNEMGGEIFVKSEVNKGSEFCFRLPFKIADMEVHQITSECSDKINQVNLEKINKNILLVEDDPIAQRISKIMLQEDFGCSVDIAMNGKEALNKVTNNTYDIVLMDIGLPDTDGFNLAKQIRELGGNYARIPIFALTAHADRDKLAAQGSIINLVLTKPISEEICAKIFSAKNIV